MEISGTIIAYYCRLISSQAPVCVCNIFDVGAF